MAAIVGSRIRWLPAAANTNSTLAALRAHWLRRHRDNQSSRYFENQAKSAESGHQFEEQKKNNNRIFLLSTFNIVLVMVLTAGTWSASSYFSSLAILSDNHGLIQNSIFEINKMNISPDERSARLNATMDALSATSELVSGAESTYTTNMRRMGGALIFAVVILFGYMLFLEYSTTKKWTLWKTK